MTFIGPIRPWHLRTSEEDKGEALRQRAEEAEAYFNDPRTIQEYREMDKAPRTMPVETLESALYGRQRLPAPNVRYGKRQRLRGFRNAEEYGA